MWGRERDVDLKGLLVFLMIRQRPPYTWAGLHILHFWCVCLSRIFFAILYKWLKFWPILTNGRFQIHKQNIFSLYKMSLMLLGIEYWCEFLRLCSVLWISQYLAHNYGDCKQKTLHLLFVLFWHYILTKKSESFKVTKIKFNKCKQGGGQSNWILNSQSRANRVTR